MFRATLVGFLTLAAGSVLGAQERTLHWRAVDVEAHLDSSGALLVRERQSMVFTGDWNGGERQFNVRVGQSFEFLRLVRIDSASARDVPLIEGDLSRVDGFEWAEGRTLRWRSRLPSDPPFDNSELTYRLDYRYSNILVPVGDSFELRHDFAFADRAGDIEQFTVSLTIDPAWKTSANLPATIGPYRLPPGEGYVVTVPLRYVRAGRPAGVLFGADALPRYALAAALGAGFLAFGLRWLRRETALGRFEPLPPSESVNDAWLQERVFAHLPEAIGAAWDESTGAAEVTAVLARLEREGKLRSRVETSRVLVFSKNTLHLELTAPRHQLRDYERSLIDALFVGGGNTISTDQIKEYYKSTGFTPAEKIRSALEESVARLVSSDDAPAKPLRRPTAVLIVSGVVLLVLACVVRTADLPLALGGGAAALVLYLLALLQAGLWRSRVVNAAPHSLRFLIPLLVMLWGLIAVLTGGLFRAGILVLAGLVVLALGFCHSVFNMSLSRHGPTRMRMRRELAAARRFFSDQLRQREPRLRDEWFPYLIAFGLGTHMDKWFQSFGAATTNRGSGMTSSMSSSIDHGSSSSSGGSWSGFGGGGGFAGGGSSGAWVAAASSLSAGVSAPSSSSSGSSSGGGGGSSSGGGGGGGW